MLGGSRSVIAVVTPRGTHIAASTYTAVAETAHPKKETHESTPIAEDEPPPAAAQSSVLEAVQAEEETTTIAVETA